MVHLAIVCYQQGKYTDAWNLYREVYELKREKLGDEDPETWRSLHEFADAYGWIGDDVKKKEQILDEKPVLLAIEEFKKHKFNILEPDINE